MNKILLLFIIGLIGVGKLSSQSIYYATLGTTNTSSIWQLDLGNCTQTELFIGITPLISDFVETPLGFFYCSVFNSVTAQMYFFNSSTGSSTLVATNVSPLNLGITTQRLLLISPTKILWVIDARFYEFDITTNVTTLLADFPYSRSWALFTYNSQIYYVESPLSGSVSNIYTITLSPTLQRNLVISLQYQEAPDTYIEIVDMATTCNIPVSVSGGFEGYAQTYDMENYTSNIYCTWLTDFLVGICPTAPLLNDVTGPLCNCTTEAGTWDWTNLPIGLSIEVCVNGTITLPHNGDEILEPGQNLSFVLVSAVGTNTDFYDWFQSSIVHIYDSPVISYIPGVTEPNISYILCPVASNAPPGAINLDDVCRDLQFFIRVIWRTPTVIFVPPNTAACTTGCQTVSVFFDGVPPFDMSYEVIFDGGNPQVFNQIFTTNSSSIQVCPSSNFSGQIQINALSITDGEDCSCN